MKNIFFVRQMIISIFFLALIGCSKSTDTPDMTVQSQNYSGEALFRGIMFAQGDVAQKITSFQGSIEYFNKMRNDYPTQMKAYDTFIDDIIVEIRQTEPTFFADFKKNIESDNLYEIDTAIKKASSLVQIVGLNSSKYSSIFKKGIKLKEHIEKDNLDVSNIELHSEVGKNKLKQILSNKYHEDFTDSKHSTASETCLVTVVAVALAVWEVAGAVNVVTIVSIHNAVFVHFIAVGSVKVSWSPEYSITNNNHYEKTITEISTVF